MVISSESCADGWISCIVTDQCDNQDPTGGIMPIANFVLIKNDKPIAWFKRKEDAEELASQLEWDGGPVCEIRKQQVSIEPAS
jgi:hypothetical protein